MEVRTKQYFFRLLNNQQGFGGIAMAVAISLVSLVGAAAYHGCPEALNTYAESLARLQDGEATNEDMNALKNTLDACRNAAGGLPIPGSAEDVLQIAFGQLQSAAVDIGMADISEITILDSESGACTLTPSISSGQRSQGVTLQLSVPELFHSQVGGISCLVGDTYRDIAVPEGALVFTIPLTWNSDTLYATCNVTSTVNSRLTICSPVTSVRVTDPLVDNCPGPDRIILNGLEWDRCGTFNDWPRPWEQAYDLCDNSTIDGHSDWRLPTKNELKSIVVCSNGKATPLADQDWCSSNGVDRDFTTPTYDASKFPRIFNMLWSSESYGADKAWIVYFQTGMAYGYGKNYSAKIRCVRTP